MMDCPRSFHFPLSHFALSQGHKQEFITWHLCFNLRFNPTGKIRVSLTKDLVKALRKAKMTTQSSQVLSELLDAGFPRTTLVSVTGNNLQELSSAKMGRVNFSQRVQEKLAGLLSWVRCMKASNKFNINPAAYYEVQMVVLKVDGKPAYTSLHELYETDIIDAEEMKTLTSKFPKLYDYNAFTEEFPTRADLSGLNDPEETEVIVHHGLPEIRYDQEDRRKKAREAVIELLERDETDRDSRRLAS